MLRWEGASFCGTRGRVGGSECGVEREKQGKKESAVMCMGGARGDEGKNDKKKKNSLI